ncbi:FMN-binding protein [Shewanella pealeana]|uniref:FMN-binding domain protein n=1 Tax=Shewanella pealeana (strain ATCC 700345 / ANG-SQ1) TaxID=398579 RepID=A8H0F1_SHEPA|nr:FMN-binding protein [Shewanella pealeana]ABV86038.1 FMN-binding domain protein [Shewanella pealeana ATCC 700345]
MKLTIAIITLSLSLLTSVANARGTYQTPEEFITQAFNTPPPKSKVLWIDDETKEVIESILSHSFRKMRLRYWQQDNESVWIMDEIGKEAPITVGIHVKDGAISQTKVLVYRESRGDEVRHDFFTDQFKSAKLTPELKLDTHIDGITGATLSVRALTKLSRIALYLDGQLTTGN